MKGLGAIVQFLSSLNKNIGAINNHPYLKMRMARLELARQSHTPLKRARIPIPPHPQVL
jgi:hypothetical protein